MRTPLALDVWRAWLEVIEEVHIAAPQLQKSSDRELAEREADCV